MKWFGLTGGIGSGKSTVAALIQKSGVPVIDADAIAKQATQVGESGYQKVLSHFGKQILDKNNQIDRQKLGRIVFQNKQNLLELETILHPIIQDKVRFERESLEKKGVPFAVYDVPLLFEKNLEKNFDGVIVVSTSEENQLKRVKQRNPHLSENEIKDRIKNQIAMSDKIKNAQFHLKNDGSISDLETQVKKLIVDLKAIAN